MHCQRAALMQPSDPSLCAATSPSALHATEASLTEAEKAFLDEYYFVSHEAQAAEPLQPSYAHFRISKVLRHRYLSTLFWSSLRPVPKPVETEADIVYVNPEHLHRLQQGVFDKGSDLSTFTFKEMSYDILNTAPLPLRVDEIITEARRRNMLNTQGLSPGATLASELNRGVKRYGSMYPFGKIGSYFYLRHREAEVFTNILITPRYQNLGMQLWENRYKYIPYEFEHRFLCYKTSTIGDGVGLGVFVRPGISIPRGTILCEYTGVITSSKGEYQDPNAPFAENALHPYSVNTGGGTVNERVIHGRDRRGFVQCYAALINDAGPPNANSAYVELDEAPGRVFVITKRRILPEEEIFILYGCTYWDIDEYPTKAKFPYLSDWVGLLERCPASHPPGEMVVEKCLHCGTPNLPVRIMPLHVSYECADVIRRTREEESDVQTHEVESLPVNSLTASIGKPVKNQFHAMSTIMVDANDPLTYGFTHEEISERLANRESVRSKA